MSSMPTESRTRSFGTSSGDPATLAWVIRPGCSITEGEHVHQPADLQRGLFPPTEPERHHAAEAGHLPGRDLVPGVLGQARVEHLRDPRVGDQEVDDARGVGAVPVHAHAEGLDAAQHEPRVERTGYRAHRVLVERELLSQFGVAGDQRTADHVGVPAEVLGRRVHHDVGTERDGLLQVRRGEGVVDDQQGAGLVRDAGQPGDVGDVQQRVRGRLAPHDLRVRTHGRAHRVQIAERNGGELQTPVCADARN
jgi:hypothetical protein